MEKEICGIKEIAKYLNISESGVRKLVREKRIEGIAEIRDESDRIDRVRIVIELKRDTNAQILLNQLYKNTQKLSILSGYKNVGIIKT